ncbi:FAD-binding oxidoreductase [Notoacmeibacter sp. MSK16QG-6]|uniref:FAD-binding oxidoreductase n=1 Tax=Notoacmeibacter sp. MSK16QG-6 TaxID=2957982 RepID=UPI00209D98AC|nr:FAD-binding oxidoreductase [Notoacmeibacter sp. MSK16QG-6]MCP1199618.1 FAD-binding oxidoreductase [Notoacmeibacter sp. MSK16QG-6]
MAQPDYQSFGRLRPAMRHALTPDEALPRFQDRSFADTFLPFGKGLSYGDSCHNDEGHLIDMGRAERILSFDPQTGLLDAEAGVDLATIIAHCGPHGWFLPVTPGTRFVTLGGAIANDVHGKNHHRRGTFGAHIESLTIARSDSGVRDISPTNEAELFYATIGGMGLTGVIVSARLRLMRVASLDVVQTVTPFGTIGDYLAMAEAADATNEYAVAWIDQMASGAKRGRGVLLAANHAESGPAGDVAIGGARLSVPFQPPLNVLNRPFLKLFNGAYRFSQLRKAGTPSRTSWQSYFYPLDGVRDWNRLYGPNGLYQHQSVVPYDSAADALPALLEAAEKEGAGSFLTVLKRFGEEGSAGLMGFARPGYTLTLDFPNQGDRTRRLLNRLDAITIAAGGAVNPYKDARMSADTYAAGFPDWPKLERSRDPSLMSDFWRRTGLVLKERS